MVALERPKTPANVGHALRAAHAFGVSMLMYSGDANCWHEAAVPDRCLGRAWRHLPVLQGGQHRDTPTQGRWRLVAVEFLEDATPLPRYHHHHAAVYVFGPEDGSISGELLQVCDDVVVIPTTYCLNLSAAVNVVLYDRELKRGGGGP